jgi:hypothetical protein
MAQCLTACFLGEVHLVCSYTHWKCWQAVPLVVIASMRLSLSGMPLCRVLCAKSSSSVANALV